jgi:hypothetical protein
VTIARETVLLADRHAKDSDAVRAQHAKLKKLEQDGLELLRKHERTLLEERGKLHRLTGAAKVSGEAVIAIAAETPREIQDAVQAAERDQRVMAGRAIELSAQLRSASSLVNRLAAAKAPKTAIASAKASLAAYEREAAELRATAKKVEARLEAARKAERSAIEATRKAALEG